MSKHGKLFCFLLLFILSAPGIHGAFSQESDSLEIILFEYREAFFSIPFPLDTVYAVSEFHYTHDSEKTSCIYLKYGPFLGYFFSEPGHSYRIKLPEPFQPDDRWIENPFHDPIPVHLLTIAESPGNGETDINEAIRRFDEAYDPFLTELAQLYYAPEIAQMRLDSFLRSDIWMETASDPEYFSMYKKFKKGILEYHLSNHNLEKLINEYLAGKPFHFEVPSYRTFFSIALDNYFDYMGSREGFEGIYSGFLKFPIPDLYEYLRKDLLLKNDTILESVLLKESFNAFYRESIPKERIMELIDSLSHNSEIGLTKVMAAELKRKFTYLKDGHQVPVFSAVDIYGNRFTVGISSEKIVLLGFCDLDRMHCQRELEYIKYLATRYEKFLESVIILKYSEASQLETFMKNIPVSLRIARWNENPETAIIYDIRALPSFFLIDRNGIMLRNPAPNPSGNFEYELFLILRGKGEV